MSFFLGLRYLSGKLVLATIIWLIGFVFNEIIFIALNSLCHIAGDWDTTTIISVYQILLYSLVVIVAVEGFVGFMITWLSWDKVQKSTYTEEYYGKG